MASRFVVAMRTNSFGHATRHQSAVTALLRSGWDSEPRVVTRTTVFEFYDSRVGECRVVANRDFWLGIWVRRCRLVISNDRQCYSVGLQFGLQKKPSVLIPQLCHWRHSQDLGVQRRSRAPRSYYVAAADSVS